MLRTLRHPGHNRFFRQACIITAHLACFALAGAAAFLLRFEFLIPRAHVYQLAVALPIWLIGKSLIFRILSIDRGWWRFVSLPDVLQIALGNLLGSIFCGLIIVSIGPWGFPRSVYLLDLLISLLLTCGVRISVRVVFENARRSGKRSATKSILIYGAGVAGQILAREMQLNPALLYAVCGYVDDDPHKKEISLQGIPVLGCAGDLAYLVSRYSIQEVLIAVPTATGPQMAIMMEACHVARVRCKTVPGVAEVIEHCGLATQIREVNVEDLLGRTPLQLDLDRIRTQHKDKIILVTGAGGSIGSELCRRIAQFAPREIVGFDIAECGLFQLEQEMRRLFPRVGFRASMGSVQNLERLYEVFEQHSPSLVYHAAAYKHVPLMEGHLVEAVENNIFGAANVVLAARKHGVSEFVMVSSDKAVRPANIMGLTKRVAELLVQSQENTNTKFISVRFGNVLGSNGSVIPTFQKQISNGGPVTVTHADMRRYFMTIPEAVQLILQASAMGAGGEIFVLDMGEPVRIMDLAHKMIILSGLRPQEDIKIEVTGIRPGEKLSEELFSDRETTGRTLHEKIRILLPQSAPTQEEIHSHIAGLQRLCARRDSSGLLLRLKELVPEYNPSTDMLKQILALKEFASHRSEDSADVSTGKLKSSGNHECVASS